MYLFCALMGTIIFLLLMLLTKDKKKKKFFSFLFMVITFTFLLIISGCRGLSVGTDTTMFVRVFNNVGTFSDAFSLYTSRFELGYRIYNALIRVIFHNAHALLFISAFVTLLLIYKFFYKESQYPFLSVFIFVALMFYCNSMCLLRQYISVAICCLAIEKLIDKKNIKFIFLVSIAVLFHSSAIIAFILLPLNKIKIASKNKYKLVFGLIIAVFFANGIINGLIKLLPQYAGYLTSEKYYLENQLGSILKAILHGIIFIFICMSYKSNDDDKRAKIEFICSLLAFAIGIVSVKGAILSRMGIYFSIVNCIALPNALSKMQNKKNKYIATLVIIGVGLAYYFTILLLRPYWSGVIPYVFWG